jgi:hypothetical protein
MTPIKKAIKNQAGQISLFFAVIVIVSVTVIAFVVNIGLFVKAKINLQNAVDAAAWSGAAVQSRQLTDIAYLNWEMRNIYKEWMFKYYVLGNLSAKGIQNPGQPGNANNMGQGSMDFSIGGPSSDEDLINIPSICLHFFTGVDLCSVYKTRGLPRLNIPGFGNLDEVMSTQVDIFSEEKAKDCATRTDLNFRVAMAWTFGMNEDNAEELAAQAPQIASNRTGAWPNAIEMALRIRNLESIVNYPPQNSICIDGSADNCSNAVDSLPDGNKIHQERTVKAFYSAYRNLGNEQDNELKNSFTLTEIPPRAFIDPDTQSLSNIFYPSVPTKYYLDLKLAVINYAIFYTMLSPFAETPTSSGQVGLDASCSTTRVALPVPGYPFGYDKNTDVLTYYAVKGEANFTGLFNPFTNAIKLTAFASAKPFGARIGPKIFDTVSNSKFVSSRSDPNKYRSSPYIFGLKLDSDLNQNLPLPIIPANQDFWVEDENDVIGGNEDPDKIKFVIPNLAYEPSNLSDVYVENKIFNLDVLHKNSSVALNKGLYDPDQFEKFRAHLPSLDFMTSEQVNDAILQVRAPTEYEAKNYLIPSPHTVNTSIATGLDSFGQVSESMTIFAPLFGPDYLYPTAENIKSIVKNFLETQKPSVEKYLLSLQGVADRLRNTASASPNAAPVGTSSPSEIYSKAADVIHNGTDSASTTCRSIAGRFSYFYLGEESGIATDEDCPRPLYLSFELYLTNISNSLVYSNSLRFPSSSTGSPIPPDRFFSAYRPGPLTGGSNSPLGRIQNPFLQSAVSYSLRNYYSTKLISLKSLTPNGTYGQGAGSAHIYSEGSSAQSVNGNPSGIANILEIDQVTSIPKEKIFQ